MFVHGFDWCLRFMVSLQLCRFSLQDVLAWIFLAFSGLALQSIDSTDGRGGTA